MKAKMTGKDKAKFRATDTWKNFRAEILKERGSVCQCCGRTVKSSSLNLHHHDLNYENYTNLSNKKVFSLLCKSCHDSNHTFYTILSNVKNLNKNRNIYNLIKPFFIMSDVVIEYFKLLDNR